MGIAHPNGGHVIGGWVEHQALNCSDHFLLAATCVHPGQHADERGKASTTSSLVTMQSLSLTHAVFSLGNAVGADASIGVVEPCAVDEAIGAREASTTGAADADAGTDTASTGVLSSTGCGAGLQPNTHATHTKSALRMGGKLSRSVYRLTLTP
jgi:hypothetical protein